MGKPDTIFQKAADAIHEANSPVLRKKLRETWKLILKLFEEQSEESVKKILDIIIAVIKRYLKD